MYVMIYAFGFVAVFVCSFVARLLAFGVTEGSLNAETALKDAVMWPLTLMVLPFALILFFRGGKNEKNTDI